MRAGLGCLHALQDFVKEDIGYGLTLEGRNCIVAHLNDGSYIRQGGIVGVNLPTKEVKSHAAKHCVRSGLEILDVAGAHGSEFY